METIVCDLCGSENSQVLYEKNQHWVSMGNWVIRNEQNQIIHDKNVYCKNCGLIYINPRMSKQELAKFYRDDYRDTSTAPDIQISERDLFMGVYNALHGKEFISKNMQWETGAKALDVGCHTGSMLAHLQSIGFEPYGVEPDARASQYPKHYYGIDRITNSTIEAFDNPYGEFDLITICDCLEHVTSVTDVMVKLRSMLKPNGYLMMAIPAWQCPTIAVCAFLSSAHTYTFSPETIRAYLKKTGFKEVAIDYSGHANTMMVLAQKADPLEEYLPDEVPDFWYVKCYLEKYQDMLNHFQYAERLISDNVLDPQNPKLTGLFNILFSYLNHDQWFPSYTALRLSRILQRFNKLDEEMLLLQKSVQIDDVEDPSCGHFDAYVRLAQRSLPNKDQARKYLAKALEHGVDYDEAVWPKHENPLEGFLNAFQFYRLYHQLRQQVAA